MSALALLLAMAAPDELPLAEYRERVANVLGFLERGDGLAASSAAKQLLQHKVRHDGALFSPDASVLSPVAEGSDPAALKAAQERLASLLAALDALRTDADPASRPDPALLERLRLEEATEGPRRGGELDPLKVKGPKVSKDILAWIEARAKTLWEWIGKFFEWLIKLFFGERREAGGGGPGTNVFVLILILVLVGIVVAAAVWILRRGLKPAAAETASSAPAAGVRDADPLSRSANEWEVFAQQLFQAGRFREAIRAWYHALLVTLFRGGLLHYRKDRTNWEYAHSLPPELAWRPGFLESTRLFEREWYGGRDSSSGTAAEYSEGARRILDTVHQETRR